MRFYKNKLPQIDDIVVCKVNKIDKDAIYVNLLEYDNMEGMVQLSNASTRKKKRSVCLLKENKQYPLLVISIDEDKGYIDLSNKFVSDDDKNDSLEKYELYLKVLKIFNNFIYSIFKSEFTEQDLENYAEKTIWKFDKNKCYKYISDIYFENGNMDILDLNEDEKVKYKCSLEKFFGTFEISTKLNFILRNPNFGGVNSIKELLNEIYEKYNLSIKLDTSPNYNIEKISKNKEENENTLNIISQFIENKANQLNMIYSYSEIKSSFI